MDRRDTARLFTILTELKDTLELLDARLHLLDERVGSLETNVELLLDGQDRAFDDLEEIVAAIPQDPMPELEEPAPLRTYH